MDGNLLFTLMCFLNDSSTSILFIIQPKNELLSISFLHSPLFNPSTMSRDLTSLVLSLSSEFLNSYMSLDLSSLLLFRFITFSSWLSSSHRHIVTSSRHYVCSSSLSHSYLTSAQAHHHAVTSHMLQLAVTSPLLQLAFISVNGEGKNPGCYRGGGRIKGEKE